MQQRLRSRGWIVSLAILAGCVVTALAATSSIPQRSDIDATYKWDLSSLYPSIDAWEADFARLTEELPRLKQFKGRLSESPSVLLEAIKQNEKITMISENLYVFAYMKTHEDARVSQMQELTGRIGNLGAQVGQAQAFLAPEILAIDSDKLLSWLKSTPELDQYRFYLESLLREKEHILPPEQEALLAMAGPAISASSKVFSVIDNADLKLGRIVDEKGDTIALTDGRFAALMEEAPREIRRIANDTVQNQYLKYVNTLAAALEGSVQRDLFLAKARGYESCLNAKLDGNKIPTEVYENLIKTVHENIAPFQKLTRIRKKYLGVDTLHTFDLSVPLGPPPRSDYTYEEAQQVILEGLKPLGSPYLADLKQGFDAGWIDVYESEGKRGGAYSWGTYTSHPYVLTNFTGRFDDVFTLAHEMGHAMNTYYVNRNEPFVYHNYTIFTAEVASTCNEAVLMRHLIANAKSHDEKLALVNYYINQFRGTFFTQVLFAEFELAIHKHVENGGAISVDFLRQTYRDIQESFYGPDLYIGPNNDLTGMKVPHFYGSYYVYQYATCYAAALAISKRITDGDSPALDDYMRFLKTGSSMYPIEVLKIAGVDMSQPEPIKDAIDIFAELVDQLELLLKEG